MLVLMFFWDSEYGFNIMGVGAILENQCKIQVQNMLHYTRGVKKQQNFTTEIRFYLFNILDSSQ